MAFVGHQLRGIQKVRLSVIGAEAPLEAELHAFLTSVGVTVVSSHHIDEIAPRPKQWASFRFNGDTAEIAIIPELLPAH